MRYYLAIIGTSAASSVLCVAILMVFMALRPAQAQFAVRQPPGQWVLPDYGRSHGYVTGPGMPKCNMAVSEECRRLYGQIKRSGKKP
jgi:hypothetical protein